MSIGPCTRLSLISLSIALILLTLPSTRCSSNQRGITPLQRCACAETLKATGQRSAYLCDPHTDDRFLVCLRDKVFCQRACSKGLFWDYQSKICGPVKNCRPVPGQCLPTTTTTTSTPTTSPIPTTTTTSIPTTTTTTAGNQHGCIDCDITPLQRCICAETLKSSGTKSAYLCDPHFDDRFLVCTPGAVVCQPCAEGTKWNADSKACARERKCLPIPRQCAPTTIAEVITPPSPPPATTAPLPYEGCLHKKIDLQLLIDSSGSVVLSDWNHFIQFLKPNFINSIFSNPESRLAIAKYGLRTTVLQPLAGHASADWLDDPKYEYENMIHTFTGDAMDQVFPAYELATRDSNAIKVLLVVTDGIWTKGSMDPSIAAKKWRDLGVEVYAIGYGRFLTLKNLKAISPLHAYKLDNLADVERELIKEIIPSLCGQTRLTTDD